MRIIGQEHEPADRAAEKIEGEIAGATERPLDVVAEHPQEDHVADDVREIGMEELVCEECHESRYPSARTDLADEGGGRQAEALDQTIKPDLPPPSLLEHN